MNARLKKISLPQGRRILAVSDLHGNLIGFQALLEKVHFSQNDILMIVGDILEKGPDSLGLLGYVIQLAKTYTVYAVCGNCDDFYDGIAQPGTPEEDQEYLHYMLQRKNSVLNEMCRELNVEVDANTDFTLLKKRLFAAFPEEFSFLGSLPDILETQRFVFVHTALRPGSLESQNREFCLSTGEFLRYGYVFSKTCVVGHWPVCLYTEHGICHNPILDREHHVYSIDGGNVLKEGGQLNALILADCLSDEAEWQSYDGLPTVTALQDQAASKEGGLHIRWTDGEVERIKTERDYSFCKHLSSGKSLWIPDSWLFLQNGAWHSDDYTEVCLEIHAGEQVSVIRQTSRGYFIKKDGFCGWYGGTLAEK